MPASKKSIIIHQRAVCVVTDWVTTFIAFMGFNIFRFYYMKQGSDFQGLINYLLTPKLIIEQISVPIILLGVYWISGYYNRPFERSRLQELLITIYSQLFNSVLFYLAALTNDQVYLRRENWMLLIILFLFLFSFTYIGRLWVTDSMLSKRKKSNFRTRTVIIGMSSEAKNLARKLIDKQNKNGINLVGFMPFGNEKKKEQDNDFSEFRIFSNIEELKECCGKAEIDQVIIVPETVKSSTNKILFLLYNLFPYNISIKINPDVLSIITPTIRLEDIMGEPFIDLTSPRISEFSKNVKRTLDVIFSSVCMIALSPVFGAFALAVKLSSPGGVIYAQERIGLHRKPFRILKFRSMVKEAEIDGIPRLAHDNDSRITKVGKWMRKYRIDELPQFWNVFKGDMSIVGPRPERDYFIDKIVKKAPWYTLVMQVRPGITSWGMVKYGYAMNVDEMIERNKFDLIYLSNMSVALDFKILIHTVKTVGSGVGK